MLKFVNEAKLRAGQVLREWKEKREEQKAQKQTAAALNSEHGHGRFFLLTVPATATICAAIVEVYWAFLFCIEATGNLAIDWATAVGSDTPAAGAWHFAFNINSVAVLIGLVCATVPIVMISMVWLPVQFTMRGSGRWRRGTMIFCGLLANVLVIVSGTVVMNSNRQEQVREGVVVEQTAAQGRAAIDARLTFEQEQLRLALANTNPYLNQAANVGAAEWERSYVAQARTTNDPRLPMLERALGAARAADARRANIEALTIQRAQAAPEAATAANVEDDAGRSLNEFSQAVQVWRPPFVAFICTLVGIFGAWWTLALMQGLNPRDVMRSGWADPAHRIEDLREQEAVVPQPMKPAREVVTDSETGEELIRITPKPHWRKQKGKKQRVETNPDIPPDETGVNYDGGNRTAITLGGAMELPEQSVGVPPEATAAEVEAGVTQQGDVDERQQEQQPEQVESDNQPDLPSDEEAALALQELELTAPEQPEQSDSVAEDSASDEGESNQHLETSDREEPETRESHLLAARTAAE